MHLLRLIWALFLPSLYVPDGPKRSDLAIQDRSPAHQEPGFFTNDLVPSLPLAVKSPYLSFWLPVGDRQPQLAGRWPQFWEGQQVGWTGFISVDGKAYTFMGSPLDYGQSLAKQIFYKFSATRTVFGFEAGPILFNVTFFTPVEPDDPVKQSLPFSSYTVSVKSEHAGSKHRVSVYTDIAGDTLSTDPNIQVFWKNGTTTSLMYQYIEAFAPQIFDERNQQAMWGRIVLAARKNDGLSFAAGPHHDVRRSFVKSGRLSNEADEGYRRIGDNWPILAFSQMMDVSQDSEDATFYIGHVRDPAISYRPTVLQDTQALRLLYLSHYPNWQAALEGFHADFATSLKTAYALDLLIYNEASTISHEYAKICALSLRQAFAAIELTGSNADDASTIQAWMKEISSDGNLNTVDVIYPAMPLYIYLAPQYLGWLIEPVLRYQSEGALYAACAHDLGDHYPYATGPSDGKDSHMPVEESGNILIIALAHARATGDTTLIARYYELFERWTVYLMRKALIPELQLTTDDFMGPIANSSSLALKGGIGIYAMGEIADLAGRNGTSYRNIARRYIAAWRKLATASSTTKSGKHSNARPKAKHLMLSYHQPESSMLAYNLYAEKLLGIKLIPEEVYTQQDAFYPSQKHKYGVPLDSRRTQTKTDWLLWSAAATSNQTVSNMLIRGVADFLTSGQSDAPFSDWYDTVSGRSPGFRARPVVGGHFSHLALRAIDKRRYSQSAAREHLIGTDQQVVFSGDR